MKKVLCFEWPQWPRLSQSIGLPTLFVVFVLLQAIDTVATYTFLGYGYAEAWFTSARMLELHGFAGVVMLKTAVVAWVFLCVLALRWRSAAFPAVYTLLVFGCVVQGIVCAYNMVFTYYLFPQVL